MKKEHGSTRGRPNLYESGGPFRRKIDRLEEKYNQEKSTPKIYGTHEMLFKCPDTGDTLSLVYPASYSPQQALTQALIVDRRQGHNHRTWETIEL